MFTGSKMEKKMQKYFIHVFLQEPIKKHTATVMWGKWQEIKKISNKFKGVQPWANSPQTPSQQPHTK